MRKCRIYSTKILSLLLTIIMIVSIVPMGVVSVDAAYKTPGQLRGTKFKNYIQYEGSWKDVYVGGSKIRKSGCGVLSTVNAVYNVNNNFIDPVTLAKDCHKKGYFNTLSGGGGGVTNRKFFPYISDTYGPKYGFKIDSGSNKKGIDGNVKNSKLVNHLKAGGTAIVHVNGHFMSIVDYNEQTEKYLVYDCSPGGRRAGLTTKAGDWKTAKQLMAGNNITVDRFWLVSNTGKVVANGDVESAVTWAINTAKDNTHGYSWGGHGPTNYDCSGFVTAAFIHAGFNVHHTGTSGMKADFTKAGFKAYKKADVTLQRGDILLKPDSHVELYIGNNQCVAAHDNYDGKTGDSSGREIQVRDKSACTFCKNKTYTYILRYESGITNYKVTDNAVSNIKNNSAKFGVSVSPKAPVDKVTLFYSKKSNSSELESIKENVVFEKLKKTKHYGIYGDSTGKKVSKIELDTESGTSIGGYKIKFDAGTTYKYRFLMKIGSKKYLTGVKEFSTKNTPPGDILNFAVADETKEIGVGGTATVTWKASSRADSYEVNVLDSSNKIVQIKTIKNKTSFTTEKINNAGTYTITVKAVNNGGSSKTISATFKVNNHLTVLFDYGNGRSEKRTTSFNGTVVAPEAPKKEGHTFINWKSDIGNTVKASAKINNLKTSATYTAQFEVNQYTVNIVDGISNTVLESLDLDYDTEFDVAKYISDNSITIPTHNNYSFEGYSEDKYTVDSQKHNIYLRYKWDSKNKVAAEITKIDRAKSNANLSITDGYSVDVNVSITNPTDTTVIKGRAIVAMKTANGRLLIETESSAFVLYPKENDTVSKTIEVFVPYIAGEHDGLPSVVEAYIVNNYTSAGIISDVATDTEKIANTNKNTWQYSTTKPVVGENGVTEVNDKEDYTKYEYTVTTVTNKQSLEPTLKDYTYTGTSAWYKVDGGSIQYVDSWPTLGNDLGSKYNNTSGVGKTLYNRYNNKSSLKTAVSTETSKIETSIASGTSHIYYHWCRGNTRDKSKMNYNVTGHKCYGTNNTSNYYKQFHAFWLNTSAGDAVDLLNTDFSKQMYRRVLHKDRNLAYADFRDVCNDSWWWHNYRIPINTQTWNQYTRYFTHRKVETKEGTTRNFAEVPTTDTQPKSTTQTVERVPLTTTVQNTVTYTATKYYAFKTTKESLTDENIYTLNGKVNSDYAGEKAVVYVYKNNQVSDSNTEYIDITTIGGDGTIQIDNAQLREKCTPKTGNFTIAVALAGEENAMLAGVVEPKEEDRIKYDVTFVAEVSDNTDFDGTTNVESQIQVISTQKVLEGADADLPNESLIPQKEGYHFVAWNNTATDIHKNLVVEAIYEKNDYAVAYVDWRNGKIDIQHFKYGDKLELPELPETEEDTIVEWIIGNTNDDEAQTVEEFFATGGTVTKDMVVSLKYSTKEFEVAIVDNEGEDVDNDDGDEHNLNKLETQNIMYGNNVQLDVVEEQIIENAGDDIIFSGWKNAETGEYLDTIEVTNDMTIYPVYEFADTVEMPTASVTTGEYTSAQTVTLSCETENAVIYYTTDGTDPEYSETAVEYTEPITLEKTTNLQFCAMAVGMNNSGTVLELYAINTATSGAKNHLVTVYSNLPESEGEYFQALIADSARLKTDMFENVTGFIFDGLFYDEEMTDEFDASAETITSETTLYAKYTPKEYTVTFYDEDETTVLSSQKVSFGSSAEEPTPSKEGFVFVGWDKEGSDFVTESKDYVAKYISVDEYATVSLNKSKVSMVAGSSKQLKATVTPDIDVELIWESSDPNVADVDGEGVVTLYEAGMTTITVTVESTGESARCEFVVSENPDENITLAGGSILDVDSQGYLRRIPNGKNTVAELRKEFINENLKFAKVDEAAQTETVLEETDFVGTGTVISLVEGDEVLDSIIVIMTGDYDGDGKVQNKDVSMLSQKLVDKRDADEWQMIALDVNGDGEVNNRDAAMLSRYLVGKETII